MRRRGFLTALPVLAFALTAGIAPLSAQEVTAKGVTVSNAWSRATPAGAKVGVAYMTIAAAAGAGDRLIEAKSDVASRVELHTHIMDGDVMKMRKVDAIVIADAKYARLQPSGDHIMLIDLKKPLKEGETVKLTLVFEKAGPIDVEAKVEGLGAKGPNGLTFQPAPDGSDPDAGKAAKTEQGGHHHH